MPAAPTSIGRYQILNELAQGGMGSLYLARDPAIDRLVAIKVLRDGLDNDELRERFLREARSAGRLRHVNIVTIFDVGEHDGYPFIAMEYVPGETLAEIIKRRAPLSIHRKIELMEELSAGLHYAHRGGIVHRDVKPANLVLDEEGVLKILDFGIARLNNAANGMTQAGMLMGTLNFMAPEQVMGLPDVDARADMFAAGAVFYELLTYQKAFPGGLDSGILHKIINGAPEPIETHAPDVDPALAAIVNRCLEKSPADRFPDMAAVRQALAAVRKRLEADSDGERIEQAAPSPAKASAGPPPLASDPPSVPDAFGHTILMPAPEPAAAAPEPSPAAEAPDGTVFLLPVPAPVEAAGQLPDVQLVVTRSGDPRFLGRTFRIDDRRFTIGRAPDCRLCLAVDGWSRQHAELAYGDDGFVIRDLGSRNGVFVNGRRVVEARLLFGAVITIGGTDLTFAMARDTTLQDLTGCVVADRYTLTRVLRESAKGSVYVADDARTFGQVAIKLLSPDLADFPGYRDKFQRDARIAVKLQHPHICGLVDYGAAEVRPPGKPPVKTQFLCFKLMSGGTLTERIEAGTPVPPARIGEWLTAIAGALDYAHRHDVLHGDLKPSAIVFDEEEHPYLTDFSVAQAVARDGRPVTGTPSYMAPELWEDGEVTPAAEQFALGAIIYYLVTGSRPFEGQDNPAVRQRNFRRGPIPAHDEAAHNGRTGVPRAMSQVLARTLAMAPADRYESATAFAAAFRASLRHVMHRADGPAVFISYQRNVSAPLAMYFADKLKAQGIKPFVDAEGLDGAGPFPAHLERAIEDTDVFVCLLARTTLDSDWVTREIQFAHRFNKPMIPVMQESYDRTSVSTSDPAVASLLAHQGLPVLDTRNLHLEHTAADLVRLVKSAIDQRDRG